MANDEIIKHIDELIAQERALRAAATGSGLTTEQRARLTEVELHLDQCWDLLRQRRAKAEFGADPDEARARPAGEVESYRQ